MARCPGRVSLHLSQIVRADELPTNDPLALLVGMVLDQHISERRSGAHYWASGGVTVVRQNG